MGRRSNTVVAHFFTQYVQTLKEVATLQTSKIEARFFTEHQNLVGQHLPCWSPPHRGSGSGATNLPCCQVGNNQLAMLVAPALWKWRKRWVFAREARQFLGPQFLLWFHYKWDLKNSFNYLLTISLLPLALYVCHSALSFHFHFC